MLNAATDAIGLGRSLTSMRVHIIDHNTVHRPLVAAMLAKSFPRLECITIAKTNDDHRALIKAADLIILSGGTRLVHLNPDTHRRIIDTILAENKPVFGICLGAEALADYFGANVIKMQERITGAVSVQLTDASLLKTVGSSQLTVYAHHIWSIQNLPQDMKELAVSPYGIEFFKHQTLPVWGTQFHPEVKRGNSKGYIAFIQAVKELGFETVLL